MSIWKRQRRSRGTEANPAVQGTPPRPSPVPPSQGEQRPTFRVRRADPGEPAGPQRADVTDQPSGIGRPDVGPPRAADMPPVLVRVGSLDRALACWAGMHALARDHGGQLSPPWDLPVCRESSTGFWLLARLPPVAAAAVAHVAGGDAYQIDGTTVRPMPLQGMAPPRTPPPDLVALDQLPTVGLLQLMAGCSLHPRRRAQRYAVIGVLTAGQLTHAVVQRCLREGATVHYRPVNRRPLFGGPAGQPTDQPEGQDGQPHQPEPAVMLEVSADGGLLPASLVSGLARLPFGVVGRYVDPAGRLLVDVDHEWPLDEADLVALVPPGQRWVIGRGGCAYSVTDAGPSLAADGLLTATSLSTPLPLEPAHPSGPRVRPIAVDVVAIEPTGLVDAVLLDEEDLAPLRQFLTGRPLAETGILLSGPGHYVLAEPAGLLTRVPFGRPLRRIGPGGLYLVDGYALSPALPPSARSSLFAVGPGRLVVITVKEAMTFRTENAVPCWSLWLPERTPEVVADVSAKGLRLLTRLQDLAVTTTVTAAETAPDPARTSELRRQAFDAANDGDLVRAADLLEELGDFAQAALLLRQAALQAEGT